MKLSDYVIETLVQWGITTVFGISGGAAVHLFDSIGHNPHIRYCCPSHEQTAATAADGYARLTGSLGVCLSTSGPGATNLLTGIASSYYDSIPTLALTGQVATHRLRGDLPIRQLGFQETDIIDIFRPITKYAIQILQADRIRYELEKAYFIAFEGRPGPVLIDLPDDLQRAIVDPATLEPFIPDQPFQVSIAREIAQCIDLLSNAKRPLVVLGAGLQTPRVDQELKGFIERFQLPMLTTWPAVDLLATDDPLLVGNFGVYGPRCGNLAIQNADLLLVLGSRLSQNLTGGLLDAFAREATIIMIDIDRGELDKFDCRGIEIALRIPATLRRFLTELVAHSQAYLPQDLSPWKTQLKLWKADFSIVREKTLSSSTRFESKHSLDAYRFLERLSQEITQEIPIAVDTGGTLTWVLNGLALSGRQRLVSAWNFTPMGYALPAAIGMAYAKPDTSILCLTGDGGLMLCLSELAVVIEQHLPIKVILFNNHCHGIQKQTLETWLASSYQGVDPQSGLSFVDFPQVAEAMKFPVITINQEDDVVRQLRRFFAIEGPAFCNVEIHPDQKLYPVLKFGHPLEQQMPLLPPGTIERQMLIPAFHLEKQ